METLFEDEHLRVVYVSGKSLYAVVTFNTKDDRVDDTFFCGATLNAKHGVECYGVRSKNPNWYLGPSMMRAANVIAARTNKPLIGYGHSMGGYACLKYSGLLNVVGAIASAPQVSIDPSENFGDLRYTAFYKETVNKGMAIKSSDLKGRLIVVYDPLATEDRVHAEAVLAMSKIVEPVRLPYMAHRGVFALRPSTILIPMFDAIASNQPIHQLTYEARQERKRHGQYFIQLGRALLLSSKFRLAVRLLEGMPLGTQSAYVGERGLFLARAYVKLGRFPEAVLTITAAVNHSPHNQTYLAELKRITQLAG